MSSPLDRIEADLELLLARISTDGTIVCQFCNASDVTDDDHRRGCPVWELRAAFSPLVNVAKAAERVMAVGDYCVSPTTAALREALAVLDKAGGK